MVDKKIDLSIVIPLYNEEKIFQQLVARLDKVLEMIEKSVEVILIDDGSFDQTAQMMEDLAMNNPTYHCVFLSRNHGHQLALSAGLAAARAREAVMVMDGDLQDPPEMMERFYQKIKEGYDVVYAVRSSRKENFLKKFVYWLYYRVQKHMVDIHIPLDSGDFSMINRKVVDHIVAMPERNRYIRGMRSWVGYKQIGLPYDRSARASGESKYSLKKLIELALNGIFGFTELPIKLITTLGFLTVGFSILYFIYVLTMLVFLGGVPKGFTTLVFIISLFSGVQLISLGVIGEYVLRIFQQVQGRPLFVVERTIVDRQELK